MWTFAFPVSWMLLIGALSISNQAYSAPKPNIIFILTDDQGYGDLSCHGNPIIKTPNMDRLHQEGARFTDFHVSPTCAPTRAALMTGRHEFRNGVTHTIFERERLALESVTIADVLQKSGYTTGIFGKWHLGDVPQYHPNKRGFDESFIHGGGGIGQTYPGSCGDAPNNTYFNPVILHNGEFEKTQGYCTDVFFNQASKWIESVKDDKPFFAYISLNAPHGPLLVRFDDQKKYAGKVPEHVAKYFGMIANIDDNIGKLLASLAKWDIERKTLVVFMNDNGGTNGVKIFNAGMRGGKNTPWLGGTRAASFWRWPGTITPRNIDTLAAHIDFFPTIAELAGIELTDTQTKQIEGKSLTPLLKEPWAAWPERTLFTHLGRWNHGEVAKAKYSGCSVRTSRWHMVSLPNKKRTVEKQSKESISLRNNWQLYDVQVDPGESKDLASKHTDVVDELNTAYDIWWDSVQPQLVNEDAIAPKSNYFKDLYWQQFHGRY